MTHKITFTQELIDLGVTNNTRRRSGPSFIKRF